MANPKSILLNGPTGTLEARYFIAPNSTAIAIICHPHPLYGGSMNNKVVTSIEKEYQNKNRSTIVFNFRGVEQSTGIHDHAIGEVDDAIAVLNWFYELVSQQQSQQIQQLYITGFSFGAYIAAMLAHQVVQNNTIIKLNNALIKPEVFLTLVAPVVDRYAMQHLTLPKNTLAIIGEKDELIAAHKVLEWADKNHYANQLIPEASHFFHGHLTSLKKALI